ncbi:hypothetical protein [Parapedobacter tibetensis]|uniref:hypothetical protein n=1 Tax=Parapedobacter tibetensis TaxID=2972951 RepID=UPI00214D703D|nr:hypothetical protein [Parapedobacter tibetensis]
MTVSYVGDRFQPTEQVDVYYAAKDVKRNYRVIGHVSELVGGFGGEERVKMEIIKKCKEVGADAVKLLILSRIQVSLKT